MPRTAAQSGRNRARARGNRQLWRMRAFSAANSASVSTPCSFSSASCVSLSTRLSVGAAGARRRRLRRRLLVRLLLGVLLRPLVRLAAADAVRDGRRRPGDDSGAGHPAEQMASVVLFVPSSASAASSAASTSSCGIRWLSISTPPLRRTAAANGAAQRFSYMITSAADPGLDRARRRCRRRPRPASRSRRRRRRGSRRGSRRSGPVASKPENVPSSPSMTKSTSSTRMIPWSTRSSRYGAASPVSGASAGIADDDDVDRAELLFVCCHSLPPFVHACSATVSPRRGPRFTRTG